MMALRSRVTMNWLHQVRSCACMLTSLPGGTKSVTPLPGKYLSRSALHHFMLAAPLGTGPSRLSRFADQHVLPDDGIKKKIDDDITAVNHRTVMVRWVEGGWFFVNHGAMIHAVVSRVNQSVADGSSGRLFAVVHLAGKQTKVTAGDLVVVQGYWPPQIGERIRLDKVLLVGGAKFSLLGRPVLEPGLVTVEATVVEKSLSHTKTIFRTLKRSTYKRINFCRMPLTTLRINSVRLKNAIDGV